MAMHTKSNDSRWPARLPLGILISVLYTGSGIPAARAAEGPQDSLASSEQSRDTLTEITVTATKRAEPLLKAPVAVTALTQNELQLAGVISLQDLTSAVPDVEMKTVGLANSVQVTIRGISNADFNETGNPAVATYIDGVYVGRTEGLTGALYDIDHLEVLRGPQGTLYGRNSTGGNLNVSTPDPTSEFTAATSVSFGNYNDAQVTGMINLPTTDSLNLRAAFVVHRSDGYFNTQGTTARNYGAADDY